MVGETVMLGLVPGEKPIKVPVAQASVNHCASAPVPKNPPVAVKVVEAPAHIEVAVAEMPEGAIDGSPQRFPPPSLLLQPSGSLHIRTRGLVRFRSGIVFCNNVSLRLILVSISAKGFWFSHWPLQSSNITFPCVGNANWVKEIDGMLKLNRSQRTVAFAATFIIGEKSPRRMTPFPFIVTLLLIIKYPDVSNTSFTLVNSITSPSRASEKAFLKLPGPLSFPLVTTIVWAMAACAKRHPKKIKIFLINGIRLLSVSR